MTSNDIFVNGHPCKSWDEYWVLTQAFYQGGHDREKGRDKDDFFSRAGVPVQFRGNAQALYNQGYNKEKSREGD